MVTETTIQTNSDRKGDGYGLGVNGDATTRISYLMAESLTI